MKDCRSLIKKTSWLTFIWLLHGFIVCAARNEALNVGDQLKAATESQQLQFPELTKKIYLNRFQQSIWFNNELSSPLLKNAIELISAAPEYGLNQFDYHCDQLSNRNINTTFQNNISDGLKPMLDVLLTDALLTFIAHMHYGRVNSSFPIKQIDQENFKGMKVDSVLNYAINNTDFKKVILNVEPEFIGYKQLQAYTKLVANQFDGDCNKITDDTYKLLALNLERWRWLNTVSLPYLIINIPAYNLTYFNKDEQVNFKVIIGKPITKTPVLSSKIRFFTTAPDWTVPKSIMRKEIIPKALRKQSYLAENHLIIYDKNGNSVASSNSNLLLVRANVNDYSIIQSAGVDNALGQIKFSFDHSFSVYLHDTPNRNLFDKSDRALSHGCIRVENPEKLVTLFLENDKNTSLIPEILDAMEKYDKKRVYLKNPFPIMVVYFTAEVKNGILNIYDDLYNMDNTLTKSLKLNL